MAILTISSEYGTGAPEIAYAMERLLGYEYIPLKRILVEATQSEKKWEDLTAKYPADASNIWKGNDYVPFIALVQSIILGHAMKDNVILLSRGINYLLFKEIPQVLGIRVVAPLEHRIATIMKKEKVNQETARLLVKQADREIDCTIHQVYGKDWDDPTAYEMKFDTSVQTLEEIIEILKNMLKVKDKLKTPAANTLLSMKHVASKIKANVIVHPDVIIPTIEVETLGDTILVRGIVRNRIAQKNIEKEVREIAGDISVRFELGCQTIKPKPIVSS